MLCIMLPQSVEAWIVFEVDHGILYSIRIGFRTIIIEQLTFGPARARGMKIIIRIPIISTLHVVNAYKRLPNVEFCCIHRGLRGSR